MRVAAEEYLIPAVSWLAMSQPFGLKIRCFIRLERDYIT